MPTIPKLVEHGDLVQINVDLGKAQPMRCLYGTPKFICWLSNDLPKLSHNQAYGEKDPLEQVDDLFHQFIIGANFSDNRRFKSLNSTPQYWVWEFKTQEVRIFGWIPQKDFFICAYGQAADYLKTHTGTYNTLIVQTQYTRNQLDLDEPKFVKSREYKDVISTKN